MNDYDDFLASLKQGDSYTAAQHSPYGSTYTIKKITIDKISESSIWANGERYNRKTGNKHGDKDAILPRKATQKEIDAFEVKQLKQQAIQLLNEKKQTKDTLSKIVSLLFDA